MRTHKPIHNGLIRVAGRFLGRSLPALLLWAAATLPSPVLAVSSENGGTGLVIVDRAHSLPASGMFVSTYAGLFDKFTPGRRLFTFTPSVTKGLGGGFEISGTLPFSGSSSDLPGDLSQRFDVRGRDLNANLRWTTPLTKSRVRVGGQGRLSWPLFSDKIRPGGTQDPDNAFDVGLKGLLSMQFGTQRYPLELHVNGGYWWSRDDGAFYYQNNPAPLPIRVAPGQKNDVLSAGVALQGGLKRMMVFTELTTEQFLDARGEIRSSENLWRLTPGVRSKITSSIAATAAVSFNLAGNSNRTAFHPAGAYPEMEFHFGLTLGQVIRRTADVPSLRTRVVPVEVAVMVDSDTAAVESVSSDDSATPVDAEVRTAEFAATPVQLTLDQQIATISRRLDQLEMVRALERVESRLTILETGAGVQKTLAAPTATSPSEAVSPPPPESLDAMLLQMQQLLQSARETNAQRLPSPAAPANPASPSTTNTLDPTTSSEVVPSGAVGRPR